MFVLLAHERVGVAGGDQDRQVAADARKQCRIGQPGRGRKE